jgi:Protein of unknown function (DUF3072)
MVRGERGTTSNRCSISERNENVVDKNIADRSSADRPAEKDPSDWVTGDEPATGPQESYLSTLAQQAGDQVDPTDLTKAEASQKIDELKDKTGR